MAKTCRPHRDSGTRGFCHLQGGTGRRSHRNNGEAAVLAWISINGGTAIIDEEVARNIGQDATTEGTISDLITTGMRLPFKKGSDFIPWAQSVGLIPN